MSFIDDCMKFVEDLILGDFNEQQMVSAQVLSGLVSLIPVMDQVMDARDISGCIYRINKRGGFAKATLEEKVDLGFAAFGVVPTVGSGFKLVFKPLYKQRKAAKGAFNGGVAMIERMLGVKKGGAVRWVRALDWVGNTQIAINEANRALEACIDLLEYLGQPHWWCPDRIERLARDIAPSLRAMRGKLAAPIRQAAAEIRKFMEEMLGEHAAAVALAVAGSASTSHAPRARAVGAGARPSGGRSRHQPVGGQARTQARPAQGRIASAVQKTAWDLYKGVNFAAKGLMGEHIVEHHVIEHKGWGVQWNRHDMAGPGRAGKAAGWQTPYRKINDGGIPLYLCSPTGMVLANGIDSLWYTNRARPHQYAVVEAKANMNPAADLYTMLGEASAGAAGANRPGAGRRGRGAASGGAKAPPAQAGSKVMQMSRRWIDFHINKSFPTLRSDMRGNYSRHVCVVGPEQAVEHIRAFELIVSNGFVSQPPRAQQFAGQHASHQIAREHGESALDQAEQKYQASGKHKRTTKTGGKGKGKP